MIPTFADFCLWAYVIIDDLWQTAIAPALHRPGPAPTPTDSELLTMLIVGEACGWDTETELVARWRTYPDLFPQVPERSRLNRRRRQLIDPLNQLRRLLLAQCELSADRHAIIDSLPIPVMSFRQAGASRAKGGWLADGATSGHARTPTPTIFGYRLHLLITPTGLIQDFTLTRANCPDLDAGVELLTAWQELTVIGDKGYLSAPVAHRLWDTQRIRLVTLRRANQQIQLPPELTRLIKRVRPIIETVNSQLVDQWKIKQNRARSLLGLGVRLCTKLTGHTLCVYLNWIIKAPNVLHLKRLTSPI